MAKYKTSTREHMLEISTPETRQKGGYGTNHIQGKHEGKFNPCCHHCQKERREREKMKWPTNAMES